MLWIRDVYPGSWTQIFPILDPNFSIPDPGSALKNLSILTQKMVYKLSETVSGLFIPDPGSRIQRSKRHQIPDPGSRIRIHNTDIFKSKIVKITIYTITKVVKKKSRHKQAAEQKVPDSPILFIL